MQLFVGGPEFLLRGLHLFVGCPRLPTDLQEFLLEFRQPRAAGRVAKPPARGLFGHGRGHICENNHHQPLQRPGFIESLDRQIHAWLAAVGPDPEPAKCHAFFFPKRFLEGIRQFEAQAFPGHGKDVPVGLAGSRFQVLAGPAADVKDVPLVIGQHGRRGVTLQYQLIRQGLEADRWFRRRIGRSDEGRARAKGRGKLDPLRWKAGFGPPKEPRFAAERGK